jgi:hypothetical protein
MGNLISSSGKEKDHEWVREYNASVKHGETDKIKLPPGISIKKRVRRTPATVTEEVDELSRKKTKINLNTKERKSITFGISDGNADDQNERWCEEDRDWLKRTLPISCLRQQQDKRRRVHDSSHHVHPPSPIIRRHTLELQQHVFIIDTGGGVYPTITSNACYRI